MSAAPLHTEVAQVCTLSAETESAAGQHNGTTCRKQATSFSLPLCHCLQFPDSWDSGLHYPNKERGFLLLSFLLPQTYHTQYFAISSMSKCILSPFFLLYLPFTSTACKGVSTYVNAEPAPQPVHLICRAWDFPAHLDSGSILSSPFQPLI